MKEWNQVRASIYDAPTWVYSYLLLRIGLVVVRAIGVGELSLPTAAHA